MFMAFENQLYLHIFAYIWSYKCFQRYSCRLWFNPYKCYS